MAVKRSKFGGYGNNANYLVALIARDRPDILERMKAGEYSSVRRAAIDAGIIRVPHPDDAQLERLFAAWDKADLESRQLFLGLAREEIEAAERGEYLRQAERRRGVVPYKRKRDGTEIPELEDLIESGMAVTTLAHMLGVTY